MSKKLDSVLEKIQKSYKIDIKSPEEMCQIDFVPTESPGLNYVLGQGVPLGRIMLLHGVESGGKSLLSSYIAAQLQKKTGKKVCIFDFEYTLNTNFIHQMGVDIDNLLVIRPTSAEDCFEMMKELIETDEIVLFIIDSISAMASKSQIEDPNKPQFGPLARAAANGLKFCLPYLSKHKATLLIIAQERANVSSMGYGPDYAVSAAGYSTKYYSSWIGRVTRVGDITENGEVTGIEMKIRNTKNKLKNPKRSAVLRVLYDKGINSDDEYLDYLDKLGLIERKGAWFYNEEWGMKVSGKNGVAEFLHSNPELYEKVKKQVNDMICGHTILDNENEDEDEEDNEEDLNFNPETGEITE